MTWYLRIFWPDKKHTVNLMISKAMPYYWIWWWIFQTGTAWDKVRYRNLSCRPSSSLIFYLPNHCYHTVLGLLMSDNVPGLTTFLPTLPQRPKCIHCMTVPIGSSTKFKVISLSFPPFFPSSYFGQILIFFEAHSTRCYTKLGGYRGEKPWSLPLASTQNSEK